MAVGFEKALTEARSKGLQWENYWIYFRKSDGSIEFRAEEDKRDGYIGYFVEDDTRLPSICELASRKIKVKKI